jgi:Flp pilus assembly protein TadB
MAALLALVGLYLMVRTVRSLSTRQAELGRFQTKKNYWWSFVIQDFRRYISSRAAVRTLSNVQSSLADREVRRLEEAGMSYGSMRSRYFFVREMLLFVALLTSIHFFATYSTLVAALLIPPVIVVAVWGPRCWLYMRWRAWQRRLDVEQLFLLQILNVGASQGWDTIRILHELADVLADDRTGSPIAVELRRAQWRAQVGGTFEDGLRAIPARVRHEGSVRKTEALADSLQVDPTGGQERIVALSREAYHEFVMDMERRASAVSVVLAAAACVMVAALACFLQVPI